MRKLLMASGAILGASASLALAQPVPANPSQGQLAAPYSGGASYNSNNNAWGIANTPSGSQAAGGLSTMGALGQNFYAVPAPGTVTIRLNGKVEADIGVGGGSASTYTNPTTHTTYKTNPVQIGSYMRLYPGFDGQSTNGIRYGAQIELRENFQNALPAPSGASNTQSSSPSSPSANTSLETVFVRRAYTYLANDNVGIVRLGQGDGVIGLFDPCIFSSQCWDAGVGVFQNNLYGGFFPNNVSGGGATNYPWLAQAGAEYGNEKIVYLSPQIYGLDIGLAYAPSQGNAYQNTSGNVGVSGASSTGVAGDALVSTTTGATTNRWYNEAEIGARYEHTFGAVDVKAYGAYYHAAREDYAGPTPTPASSNAAGFSNINYNPISFYQAGLAVTSAGLTAAVTWQGGKVNNQLALLQSGGAPMNATVFGLTYINGPWTVGFATGIIDSQGNQGALVGVSQRHQFETSIGGNYKLAPGVNLVLEYSYYQTHQGDFNFISGTTGAANNNVKTQGLIFTTMLTW
ncbi:MAG TPA: porin [Rhodopila sp.]